MRIEQGFPSPPGEDAFYADEPIRFAVSGCSLGAFLVAATEKGVCAILLGDDPDRLPREMKDRFPEARLVPGGAELAPLLADIASFIEAPSLGLDLVLDVRGTPFQEKVWQALRTIPAGSTASYGEVAERIGAPREAQAVAEACAANAIAVAIPCHRVVRKNGQLGGYRWGFGRKRALLNREAAAAA
jgi:AraC family transcriptional regulator, regulatory protein of adaptative response / methylated-DNA-[protein]-cysteine methyltransferase